MNLLLKIIFIYCLATTLASCAGGNSTNNQTRYLFYQHGGLVTVLGDNAINQSVPEWGPYEYSNILDSLRKRDFIVISEIRKQNVPDSVYASKIVSQIDSLMGLGAKRENILILGASAGWNITLMVASKLNDQNMRYVLMGGCWPDTYKSYIDLELTGHFLSIIEASDPHGTCNQIFDNRSGISSYKELVLNTGLSHGFIYKGHAAWIDPIVSWFNK